MADDKYDRVMIRFDPALGAKIREMARRRGLTMAEYCRTMCSLEVLSEDPAQPFGMVQQQLKEALGEVQTFGELDPQQQGRVLGRTVQALMDVSMTIEQALEWLTALARASDAVTGQRGARRREPLDG
jgi:hypothetical protein